ncbi:MAG: aminotransferase class IV [Candidatus Altiarchaeota archaeon]
MTKIVYNGEVLDEASARLPVLDWGVLYGYGIYETMKAVNGRVFKLERHLSRLREGAGEIRLPLPWSDEEITDMVNKALSANNLSDAYIRLTITRGVGEPGLKLTGKINPNIIVLARPLPQDIREKREKGVRAAVTEKHVRCTRDVRCRVKTTNYLMNALAKLDAKDQGLDELILLNEKGFAAEFSSANLFIVSDGKLYTPPFEAGILPGVTRETVLELAVELGIESFEENISVDQLYSAEEVFKSSAIQGVIPVVELDGKPVGDGKPGETTRNILREYIELVERGGN